MTRPIWQDVLEFMVDTVIFTPRSGSNKFNEPTYGASVSVKGRMMATEQKTRTVDGVEITDMGKFICYGAQPTITTKHRMVFNGVEYNINSVNPVSDENGAHHTDIIFGR